MLKYSRPATENFNVDNLKKRIEELLPVSAPFFGKDALTDKPARFFVTEIIREKLLLNYDKEIPYSTEVLWRNSMRKRARYISWQ